MEGNFGICRGVGWGGWVLGGLRWPSGGFSHTRPSKESLQENLKEENRESTRGLQEEAERSFHYFEGVRVGGKGG